MLKRTDITIALLPFCYQLMMEGVRRRMNRSEVSRPVVDNATIRTTMANCPLGGRSNRALYNRPVIVWYCLSRSARFYLSLSSSHHLFPFRFSSEWVDITRDCSRNRDANLRPSGKRWMRYNLLNRESSCRFRRGEEMWILQWEGVTTLLQWAVQRSFITNRFGDCHHISLNWSFLSQIGLRFLV